MLHRKAEAVCIAGCRIGILSEQDHSDSFRRTQLERREDLFARRQDLLPFRYLLVEKCVQGTVGRILGGRREDLAPREGDFREHGATTPKVPVGVDPLCRVLGVR